MKNFVHKITCVLVMCAATVAFTACSDSDNKGDGPVTGTLSVETGALKFTSGAYSKGFEVETDGTVGAIQVDVNYKGAETGWITAKVNDGDVVVTVARNTGDARTADVVLSAKGAESVTVSISQKAVFSSIWWAGIRPMFPIPKIRSLISSSTPYMLIWIRKRCRRSTWVSFSPDLSCPLPPSPVWPTSSWG